MRTLYVVANDKARVMGNKNGKKFLLMLNQDGVETRIKRASMTVCKRYIIDNTDSVIVLSHTYARNQKVALEKLVSRLKGITANVYVL